MGAAFDIAIAVAAELNAGFAGEFTAAVVAAPLRAVDELQVLTVQVVPRAVQPAQVSRGTRAVDVTVDIGIQQHLGAEFEGNAPALAAKAEAVLAYMWDRTLASKPAARFVGAVLEPVVDHELLRSKHVFLSVVSVTYRVTL